MHLTILAIFLIFIYKFIPWDRLDTEIAFFIYLFLAAIYITLTIVSTRKNKKSLPALITNIVTALCLMFVLCPIEFPVVFSLVMSTLLFISLVVSIVFQKVLFSRKNSNTISDLTRK